MYSINEAVQGLFGDNEKKIADFLATATGAAFENAESFEELEKRVASRTEILRNRSEELELTAATLRKTQASLESARDAAESANSAKSEFLARMSHEIRTPIAAIIGFSELILRGVVKPEQQLEKIESIHVSGKHLLRLINNLLDLSKIEADEFEVENIPINPGQIAMEVVQTLQVTALRSCIELNSEIIGSIPVTIYSDPTQFRQVLTNLLSNAIKFTSEGNVTVRLSCDDGASQKQLVIEVEDTGIGMTEDQLQKVFDPFTQADTSITRRFGGTGLGLSITKRILKSMGGNISVASSPGIGSCFRIEIPVSSSEMSDLVAADQFAPPEQQTDLDEWGQYDFANRKILIVDDAPTNREFLCLVLERTGAKFSCCENGREAVELLKSNSDFQLILMDMQMPILDGYSATQEIRSLGMEMPIMALTANAMKDDEQRCMKSGCNEYLPKPIDTNEPLKKTSRLLRAKPLSTRRLPSSDQTESPISSSRWLNRLADMADELNDKTKDRLPEIEDSLVRHEFECLANHGHWLKGTAGTIGLNELALAGEKLDRAGRQQNIELAETAVKQIRAIVGCD